jgi:hypothetical protein
MYSFITIIYFLSSFVTARKNIIDFQKCIEGHHGVYNDPNILEKLAYKYGTDKSHDDHKYVDTYSMLFQHHRFRVHNITEVTLTIVHILFLHFILYINY